MITIRTLDAADRAAFGSALQRLESLAQYPLGADHFRIDHGPSYFAFFDRLGPTTFQIALEGDEIIACAAGVERLVTTARGPTRCWYLCDLKVHPDYRGRGLPARLYRHNLLRNYLRCGRACAVSMNPPEGPNPVVDLIGRLPWAPLRNVGGLNIFSLDYDQVTALRARLTDSLGPLSFLSLLGQKDLILASTGRPLALRHVQYGAFAAAGANEPEPGATHMLCAPAGSPLDQVLRRSISVTASATLLTHRLSARDCSFILTSDI